MVLSIPRETIEKLEATVTATADPTVGTNWWAVAVDPARPATWVAGSWSGAAESLAADRYRATAVSPTFGLTDSGADIELAAGSRYSLFVKVTDVSESAVRNVGLLILS